MCFLIQKHVFIQFLNNQIDVIVGKWLNIIFLSFIDHSFEERRKILKGKRREESIINVKLT